MKNKNFKFISALGPIGYSFIYVRCFEPRSIIFKIENFNILYLEEEDRVSFLEEYKRIKKEWEDHVKSYSYEATENLIKKDEAQFIFFEEKLPEEYKLMLEVI